MVARKKRASSISENLPSWVVEFTPAAWPSESMAESFKLWYDAVWAWTHEVNLITEDFELWVWTCRHRRATRLALQLSQ